jgi:hypothetical protein
MTDPDLQTLWQSQKPEEPPMSLAEIRSKAGAFQRRILVRNVIEYAAGLIVVPSFALMAWNAPQVLTKVGAVLVALGALVCLWQLHARGGAKRAPDAGAASLIDFHRQELERQRDALASVWLWYLGPFVPGMALILLSSWLAPVATRSVESQRAGTLMMTVIVVLVFLVIFLLNKLGAHHLQKEIDKLDALQGG